MNRKTESYKLCEKGTKGKPVREEMKGLEKSKGTVMITVNKTKILLDFCREETKPKFEDCRPNLVTLHAHEGEFVYIYMSLKGTMLTDPNWCDIHEVYYYTCDITVLN